MSLIENDRYNESVLDSKIAWLAERFCTELDIHADADGEYVFVLEENGNLGGYFSREKKYLPTSLQALSFAS